MPDRVEGKIADRLALLRFLSRSATDPNEKTMLNIYKSLVRTIITYGYPVLLSANDRIWTRLQILQNKGIRAALNLSQYTSVDNIHRTTNIPKIRQYALDLLERATTTAQSNNDKILRDREGRVHIV